MNNQGHRVDLRLHLVKILMFYKFYLDIGCLILEYSLLCKRDHLSYLDPVMRVLDFLQFRFEI